MTYIFVNDFMKAVKNLVCMAVDVTINALSTVRAVCVTFNLETVLHVNLDGQESLVSQVYRINNLRLTLYIH